MSPDPAEHLSPAGPSVAGSAPSSTTAAAGEMGTTSRRRLCARQPVWGRSSSGPPLVLQARSEIDLLPVLCLYGRSRLFRCMGALTYAIKTEGTTRNELVTVESRTLRAPLCIGSYLIIII